MFAREVRDFDQWRTAARPLLAADVEPGEIAWSDWRTPTLLGGQQQAGATHAHIQLPPPAATNPAISPRLLTLLRTLSYYRDAGRWDLLYRLTWRVLKENRTLLENDADPDVRRARLWEKAIHQDVHKMHAFVRFHETHSEEGGRRYVAWFEPSHEILRCATPFFEKRFPNMRWLIATPDGAALWADERTQFIESPLRSELPRQDTTHDLWRTYYRNICNIARINPEVMRREMPQRYWRNLPEASEIGSLLQEGAATLQRVLREPAAPDDERLPLGMARSLEQIAKPPADSPQACRLCGLWRNATQAVLGEGPGRASIMLVGEQPGDDEDIHGRPFVGPAGRLLDEALRAAGISRDGVYITNAVKHFKWEPRGKRRLHKRPDQQEIRACGTWLEREIASVAPAVIVALGATAIRSITGTSLAVADARQNRQKHPLGAEIVCAYHPAAILRADASRKDELLRALEADLRRAAAVLS